MNFYRIRAIILIKTAMLVAKVFRIHVPLTVSAAAFIERDGKMLFLDLSYMKGFGLPGGLIERDEDAETAIKREVFEETGLHVVRAKYLWSIASSSLGFPSLMLAFAVEVEGNEKGSHEGSLHWLLPHEVVDKMAYEIAGVALTRYMESLDKDTFLK